MAADTTFRIGYEIDIEGAIRDARQASGQINKAFSTVQTAASAVAAAGVAVGAAFVFSKAIDSVRTLAGVLADVTKEAAEADEIFQGVANALRTSGDLTDESIARFEELANSLARVSRFDNDVILGLVRLGKQFNLSNNETQKFIRASVELASRLGVDLETAARQLGQTLDGTIGRLGEQIPSLKNLSKESLILGGALDEVLKRFGGSAAASLQTFNGAVDSARNAYGDFREEIGKTIVENEAVRELILGVRDAFIDLATFVSENRVVLAEFVRGGVQLLILGFSKLVSAIQFVDEALTRLRLVFSSLGETIRFALSPVKDIRTLGRALRDVLQSIKENADIESQTNRSIQERAKIYRDVQNRLAVVAGAVEVAGIATNRELQTARQINEAKREQEAREVRLAALREEQAKKAAEEAKKEQERLRQLAIERQNFLRSLVQDPTQGIFGGQQNQLGLTAGQQNAGARGVGIATAVLSGRAGAQNVLQQVGEAAGQAFAGIPGFGALVGLLAQPKEVVKAQVEAFIDALPVLIEAIAEAIPVVIEVLAEKADDIIVALVRAIPKVAAALIRSLAIIPQKLAEGATRFVGEILNGAFLFVSKILEGAGRFIEELVSKVGEGLGNAFSGIFGGGSGGGGLLGGILNPIRNLFGAITGGGGGGQGAVPDEIPVLGWLKSQEVGGNFQTQRMPAERPVDSKPTVVSIQVGRNELARAILDLSKGGYRLA